MVFDHGVLRSMREMPISKFKATCLAVLEEVRRTRTPVRVTRFGRPVADVLPPSAAPEKSGLACYRWLKDSR
jgi:prevent-host-death family protein